MSNLVLIQTAWGEQDAIIQIERTDEFAATAQRLSDYIRNLPLTVEENNQLVALMVEQVQIAERTAFYQGFELGVATNGNEE